MSNWLLMDDMRERLLEKAYLSSSNLILIWMWDYDLMVHKACDENLITLVIATHTAS